jgi:hypothetical protein
VNHGDFHGIFPTIWAARGYSFPHPRNPRIAVEALEFHPIRGIHMNLEMLCSQMVNSLVATKKNPDESWLWVSENPGFVCVGCL